jgi:hypothetical protein
MLVETGLETPTLGMWRGKPRKSKSIETLVIELTEDGEKVLDRDVLKVCRG